MGCGLWLWFGVTLIESSSSQFFGAEGFLGLWWGFLLPILSLLWVEKHQTLMLGMGVGVSLQTPSRTPLSPQGDIQELLISSDPQAAFRACEQYLPGCDDLDPVATGVSKGLVLRSLAESSLAPGLRNE